MRVKELYIRAGLFAVAFLALVAGYRVLLGTEAPGFFNDPMEDLSFGWYVPVFSLYVLWREREELVKSVGEPSAWGLVLSLPFFFLGIIGTRGGQVRFEMVGFIGLLITLTLAFFGRKTMRRVLFPALFLCFCIPLHTFLDLVTIHLRMFAVSCAYGILQGCGADVIRNGTMLMSSTGSFAIDVAEPCSGMRSLFAMMALTAGYAYFTQPTWLRRALLFSLSLPIAVAGNVVRIFTIVAIASGCSSDFATGFYHDYSGYVVFLVGISLMAAAGGLITKGAERCADS